MKTSIARPRQSLSHGQIVDLPEDIAKRLIARGAAEPAASPEPGELPLVETQMSKPDETRTDGGDGDVDPH